MVRVRVRKYEYILYYTICFLELEDQCTTHASIQTSSIIEYYIQSTILWSRDHRSLGRPSLVGALEGADVPVRTHLGRVPHEVEASVSLLAMTLALCGTHDARDVGEGCFGGREIEVEVKAVSYRP